MTIGRALSPNHARLFDDACRIFADDASGLRRRLGVPEPATWPSSSSSVVTPALPPDALAREEAVVFETVEGPSPSAFRFRRSRCSLFAVLGASLPIPSRTYRARASRRALDAGALRAFARRGGLRRRDRRGVQRGVLRKVRRLARRRLRPPHDREPDPRHPRGLRSRAGAARSPIRRMVGIAREPLVARYLTGGGLTPLSRATSQPRFTFVRPSGSTLTTLNSTRRFFSQAAGFDSLSSGQYSP